MQISEFAYFSSKSGKHMKQMSDPPFWGDVGVKKWSPFLDSGAQSPIFGHLKILAFSGTWKWDFGRVNPKMETPKWWTRHWFYVFTTFGWEISKFWMLHILASFLVCKKAFSSKWWLSEENAQFFVVVAEIAFIHAGTKYIKRQWDFDNFLKFRHTLLCMNVNIKQHQHKLPEME